MNALWIMQWNYILRRQDWAINRLRSRIAEQDGCKRSFDGIFTDDSSLESRRQNDHGVRSVHALDASDRVEGSV